MGQSDSQSTASGWTVTRCPERMRPVAQGRCWIPRGCQLNSRDEEHLAFTMSSAEAATWPPVWNQRPKPEATGPRGPSYTDPGFQGPGGWRQHRAGQAPGKKHIYTSHACPPRLLACCVAEWLELKEFRVELFFSSF